MIPAELNERKNVNDTRLSLQNMHFAATMLFIKPVAIGTFSLKVLETYPGFFCCSLETVGLQNLMFILN